MNFQTSIFYIRICLTPKLSKKIQRGRKGPGKNDRKNSKAGVRPPSIANIEYRLLMTLKQFLNPNQYKL